MKQLGALLLTTAAPRGVGVATLADLEARASAARALRTGWNDFVFERYTGYCATDAAAAAMEREVAECEDDCVDDAGVRRAECTEQRARYRDGEWVFAAKDCAEDGSFCAESQALGEHLR
ncbi:hypothetical protein M885DRAFT_537269 [Pelagophyceae sp. CCMP2097]|nr:hypothetical protein M885DRAFT_537269 [Pelagophyceae sp. CCMP2097]